MEKVESVEEKLRRGLPLSPSSIPLKTLESCRPQQRFNMLFTNHSLVMHHTIRCDRWGLFPPVYLEKKKYHQMRAQLHNHVKSVKIVIFLAQAQLVHAYSKKNKKSWSFVGFKCHIIVQVNQSVSSQSSGGTVEELPLIIGKHCVVV